ncbi:hypothetical protein [Methanogenium organophilum]|uniref:Uncharacterized protein n=1 Tax=Methanogenium organophilum TaxID=2199 RepID=A0A9X9S4G8_METOG|nr:hypothetical protein [Methanogenium organophilum]WAI01829.1 hypothetical protein OU421_02850 [Methanogenium organophilum]
MRRDDRPVSKQNIRAGKNPTTAPGTPPPRAGTQNRRIARPSGAMKVSIAFTVLASREMQFDPKTVTPSTQPVPPAASTGAEPI